MEEFDDLIPQPTPDGQLILTYRAWSTIDTVIFTMGRTLISLDLSFNRLKDIPVEIGDLYMLKEFSASGNVIEGLPDSVGLLKKLQVLRVNGNKIKELPNTITSCINLKDLTLSENKLTSLPSSIHKLTRLSTLLLQNNDLHELPTSLGALSNIQTINVANNSNLFMIPKKVRDNTTVIKWILLQNYKTYLEIVDVNKTTSEYKGVVKETEVEVEGLKKKEGIAVEKRNRLRVELGGVSFYVGIVGFGKGLVTGCLGSRG